QIFSSLKKSGLVKSVRGAQGGYLLSKNAEDITVGDILVVLEGAYIVASEGIRDKYGNFICEQKTSAHDKFGHSQLGGVSNYLKN
ncbi:Rrf2 family transcriptional regulator, partial [Clostridioides difficile]